MAEWIEITLWAVVCIWERLTGQPVSCPDCWKCTVARWGVFLTFLALVGLTVYMWVS